MSPARPQVLSAALPTGLPAVLIVEDDADIREALAEVLVASGYEAIAARDGEDALEKAAGLAAAPALVLLDWMMPRMNGAKFLQEKARIPTLAGVPVVVLTADRQTLDEPPPGIAATVPKPPTLDILLDVVAQFARR